MKAAALGVGVSALMFVGCASVHLRPDSVIQAEVSIAGAQQAGADANPHSQLVLKYATDEVAQARIAEKNGDGETAQRLIDRAQVDAELALALARQGQAEAVAKRATEDAKSVTQ